MGKWRTKGLILTLFGIPLILLSSFGTVSATLITGDDFENLWGTLYPPVSMDVAYDTETTILSFSWDGAFGILTPIPSLFGRYLSYWKITDERGFSESVDEMDCAGSEELYYYNSAGTWLKVKVVWMYSGGLWFVIPDCKVKLWIPHTPALWDLNEDHIIDTDDIAILSLAYFSHEGDPNWNPDCDMNFDNYINYLDLAMVTRHYGESY